MGLERLTSGGGSMNINAADGLVSGLQVYAFSPDQDTVIDTLDGIGIDTRSSEDFLETLNISGKTIKQGSVYMVQDGAHISDIELGSGAIIVYQR